MTNTQSTGQTGGANNETEASTLDRTRETVSDAARRAAEGIESNPLGILVGGLAVGALAGSLIPRSAKEKELLAPVGQKLGTSARAAIQAAKEAGQSELESRGFTPDAGREQVRNLLGGLGKALSTAGAAAVQTARGGSGGGGSAGADSTAGSAGISNDGGIAGA